MALSAPSPVQGALVERVILYDEQAVVYVFDDDNENYTVGTEPALEVRSGASWVGASEVERLDVGNYLCTFEHAVNVDGDWRIISQPNLGFVVATPQTGPITW